MNVSAWLTNFTQGWKKTLEIRGTFPDIVKKTLPEAREALNSDAPVKGLVKVALNSAERVTQAAEKVMGDAPESGLETVARRFGHVIAACAHNLINAEEHDPKTNRLFTQATIARLNANEALGTARKSYENHRRGS